MKLTYCGGNGRGRGEVKRPAAGRFQGQQTDMGRVPKSGDKTKRFWTN